jgi:hypothetical protein
MPNHQDMGSAAGQISGTVPQGQFPMLLSRSVSDLSGLMGGMSGEICKECRTCHFLNIFYWHIFEASDIYIGAYGRYDHSHPPPVVQNCKEYRTRELHDFRSFWIYMYNSRPAIGRGAHGWLPANGKLLHAVRYGVIAASSASQRTYVTGLLF